MANPQLELQRARAALTGGDVEAAARICRKLLTMNPRDIDARYLQGRCMAALGRWREAADDFRRVLEVRPNFFGALVDLGLVETFAEDFDAARAHLERARALDARPAELHFALGTCQLGSGDPAGAAVAFREAITRNPLFPDAHNNLGVAYDRLGRLSDAISCFRQAVAAHGQFADAHRNLGDALLRLGNAREAVTALRRAASLLPADAAILAELGAAQLAAEDFSNAISSLEQALALKSALPKAAIDLGEANRHLNLLDQASAAFRFALSLDPNQARAHIGLGRIAVARNRLDEAAGHLFAAAEAGRIDVGIQLAVAHELEQLGYRNEALSILRGAANTHPRNADVQDALGASLHRSGNLPEALDCYESALEIDDGRVETRLNSGHALEAMGAYSRALACYEQVLARRPEDARAVASVASCAFRLCNWDLAQDSLARLSRIPHGVDELQAFLMVATDLDAAVIAESLRRRSGARSWPPAPTPQPHFSQIGTEPMRVAYVSPDFRIHPVAFALAGVIDRHDRARVKPIGVALAAPDGSALATRLRGSFDEFIDASTLSDRDVVTLLRERGVHIAVDLAGLTTGSRTSIFAMRAAPAQINYLGFPSSMGMNFMDFIIADEIVLPPSDEIYYQEEVLRLPNCYLPFDDTRFAAAGFDRPAAGLPAHGFVFCAFTNGYKISREIFQLWMELLRAVPDSILWLRSMGPTTAASLKAAATRFGISADRLVFTTFIENMDEHLSRLQLADLFLDTRPYNAHTTAAEALWAEVPVITCRGRTFAGRVGASLLSASGLSELICSTLEEYRALALQIAQSPAYHSSLRDKLRRNRRSAAAFDTGRYTHDLEDVYLEAYRRTKERASASLSATG